MVSRLFIVELCRGNTSRLSPFFGSHSPHILEYFELFQQLNLLSAVIFRHNFHVDHAHCWMCCVMLYNMQLVFHFSQFEVVFFCSRAMFIEKKLTWICAISTCANFIKLFFCLLLQFEDQGFHNQTHHIFLTCLLD